MDSHNRGEKTLQNQITYRFQSAKNELEARKAKFARAQRVAEDTRTSAAVGVTAEGVTLLMPLVRIKASYCT